MRNKLARLLPLLLFGLLLGCGSPGEKQEEPAFPRPQPGANPASLPQTPLRFINQSSAINGSDFQQAVAAIDLQIRGDLNPRWGINGVAIAYFGPQDEDIPSVILRDDTGQGLPGGYTDGTNGYVQLRQSTAHLWRAYMSHVAINLLTPGYLAGQSVEAYDYHVESGLYLEEEPWELADFDFPSRHGFSGVWHDWRGEPAHDLLHKLDYP